jgi:HSP20 family protein
MVEKSHTASGHLGDWWPSVYGPLRSVGQKIADFFAPEADASTTDQYYEINVELPGVAPEDVDVTVHENNLTIKGEKQARRDEQGRTYFFSERIYGAFQRSFRLPADTDPDKIAADFKDGVLTIRIAKQAEVPDKARKIQVNRA